MTDTYQSLHVLLQRRNDVFVDLGANRLLEPLQFVFFDRLDELVRLAHGVGVDRTECGLEAWIERFALAVGQYLPKARHRLVGRHFGRLRAIAVASAPFSELCGSIVVIVVFVVVIVVVVAIKVESPNVFVVVVIVVVVMRVAFAFAAGAGAAAVRALALDRPMLRLEERVGLVGRARLHHFESFGQRQVVERR